jgi:hypothetical protein
MADFYQSNPNTGVVGLGQAPNLKQILASLSQGSAVPAATQAGASASTPTTETPTVAGAAATGAQRSGPAQGNFASMSPAQQAASVSAPNTAINPSLSNSLKMAGMVPGFGPTTVLGAVAGNLTGLSNNPFNPPGVMNFGPAQQQALNTALAAIANSNLPAGVKQAQMAAALAQARMSATSQSPAGVNNSAGANQPSNAAPLGTAVGPALSAGTSLGTAIANAAMAGNYGGSPSGGGGAGQSGGGGGGMGSTGPAAGQGGQAKNAGF